MKTFDVHLELKIYPDSVLRQICEPVERFDTELREIIDEMFVLMSQNEGIGLAAPQAGLAKQFFVCGIESEMLSLINPVIVEAGQKAKMIEGCLSLPDMRVNVTRNDRIYIVGLDSHGRRRQYELTGLWARVVQHEMDHLKGVLISDYGDNVNMEQREKGCDNSDSSDEPGRAIDESQEDYNRQKIRKKL